MTTAYITHPICAQHIMADEHPESPRRLSAINDRLIASGIYDYLLHIEAPKAEIHQLQLAHDRHYIEQLFNQSPDSGFYSIDEDTAMNPHTLAAALYSAGAAIRAVDGVVSGEFTNAFCATRPPGHHAESKQAMGFCFFNNAAIAACHAVKEHRVKKVAIVDFDVHHGNGTQDIVSGSFRMRYWSSFQSDIFPHTDTGKRTSRNIQLEPIAPGCSGEEYREIIMASLIPWLNKYKPQLIILSSGFDGHIEDDMSQMRLSDSDYLWLIEKINSVAKLFCGGKIVSLLEGGYDLPSLSRCVSSHIKELANL